MISFRPPHRTVLGILGLLATYAAPGFATSGFATSGFATSGFAAETIVLASTTSVQDSGLLDRILPLFTQQTGIEVHVVAQGTGQALATAAHGDADLVLVHDPDAEAAFMAAGHGLTRSEIAWNDFIVVGPVGDPARIAGTQDVVAALRAIAAARVAFVSRGDRSGTDALEKRLWKAAGLDPVSIGGGWYRDIGGGMGAALNAAAAMDAYTLSDRATWLNFGNQAGLRIELEGDRRLLNRYDVILLNPQLHPHVRQAAAQQLASWLGSPEGQTAIAGYLIKGQRLFHPESDAKP
jgi:tungstate transport system substrate-binding protein